MVSISFADDVTTQFTLHRCFQWAIKMSISSPAPARFRSEVIDNKKLLVPSGTGLDPDRILHLTNNFCQ